MAQTRATTRTWLIVAITVAVVLVAATTAAAVISLDHDTSDSNNDTAGSVAVLIAAGIIATTGWLQADAVASLVIATLIIPRTLKLLRESVDVLLESTPKGLDLSAVRDRILSVRHVHDVHDLHASQVATGLPVLTAHVVVDDSCFLDGHLGPMLDEVQQCLVEEFDVEHSTIQFEAAVHGAHEHETHA